MKPRTERVHCYAHAAHREWCKLCREADMRAQQREANAWYAAEVARMAERAPA